MQRRRGKTSASVARVAVLAAIIATPLAFDTGSFKVFDAAKVAVLGVGVGVAVVAVVVGRVRSAIPFPRITTAWLCAGFLGAAALATVFSVAPSVSFFGWYARWHGFVTLALSVGLALCVMAVYWNDQDRLHEPVYALGAASVVATAYLWLQWLGLDRYDWVTVTGEQSSNTAFGTFGNTNFAGGFLGATVPWLFVAWVRARRRWVRLVIAAAGVAQVWAVWVAASRGGYVAAAASVVALAIARRASFPRRLRVAPLALAVAGVVAVGAGVLAIAANDDDPEHALGSERLSTGTLEVRLFWWEAAVDVAAERPLLGAGPDTFGQVYPRHLDAEASRWPDAVQADKPHNIFLEFLADTGVVGLGALLVMMAWVVWHATRIVERVPRGQGWAVAALVGVLGGYTGQALFSIDVVPVAILLWVAVGGLAAAADPGAVAARRSPPLPRRAQRPVWRRAIHVTLIVAVVGGAVYGAWVPVSTWLAERAVKAGKDAENRNAPRSDIIGHYARAIDLRPTEPVYHGLAGEFLIQAGDGETSASERERLYRLALERYEEMDRLQPDFHIWKLSLADAYQRLGRLDPSNYATAEASFFEALELAPRDHRVWQRFGVMLNEWGIAENDPSKHCEALVHLRRAAEAQWWETDPRLLEAQTHAFLGQFDEAKEILGGVLSDVPDNAGARELLARIRAREADIPRRPCPD